ncbi:autotransporter outer membrane beta-barrel domain-containing protein [Bartonella sp. CL162QHHD]|uniref:autotransporter outer membrane beta-barrel domain-containing protein n=1 Tax=Bartonella sp. CL162QHHD TaxID=3243516 RepID=UPI0035CFD2D3
MFKNHLSLCHFTTVIFFFVYNTDAGETSSEKKQYSCNEGASFYRCNDGKTHEISKKTYQLTGESSDAAIEASGKDTVIEGEAIIINGVSNANVHSETNAWTTAVKSSNGGGVVLFDSMLNNVSIGGDVNEEGAFEMQDGVIKATRMGISVAGKGSFVSLTKTEIKTSSDAIGLLSHNGAKIYMKEGKIDFTSGIGVQTGGDGEINLDGVSITGRGKQGTNTGNHREASAFSMLQGKGSLNFQKGNVNVIRAHGIALEGNDNNTAHIKYSNVFVRGNAFNGMRFFWEAVLNDKKTIMPGKGTVYLTKTTVMAPESTAIYSRQFESFVKLSQHSTVSGDSLLKAVEHSNVKIEADASTLVGGAHVDGSSTAKIELKNGSKWILSRPRYDKLQNSDASGSNLGDYSFISSVNLMGSSLIFKELKSKTTDGYQTLLIGKGSGTVYRAQGDALLYLNAYLDKGGALQEQKTDRLLINGDLEGKTTVHVYSVPGSSGALTGDGGNNQGISIIQVYGQAAEDSFQLKGGYVTLEASPYQYHLKSYGPGSTLGAADSNQRVLKNSGTFWDFRLESKFVDSSSLDPTKVFPVLDLVVPPSSDDIPSFPKIHPNITGGEDGSIDSNSQQKPQEPSLSSPVDSPDRDFHLTTTPNVSDVFVLEIPHPPSSFAPVIPAIAESNPVAPPASGSPVPPHVSPTPSVVAPPASSFSVPASVFEPSSHFEPNVRVVVPQVLTYILVPNTLFYAGLMDISNQNKQLQSLRTVSGRLLKNDGNPALFLRGYGGHHRYTSNLSVLKYGDYGGELDYNALEANILLKKIESAYSTTSFGIMGNYGKLSLQPRKVKQSQESIFDKWTITAYGSMQHDTGLYMDGLFSYGLFNGNVLTLERGKTATLRGKPLSVSLTAGKTFMIGSRYFIFEPQVQFVYQNLQFHKTRDIDNFNIDMRSPDHWGMRIGGYLTKTLTFTKDAHVLSFYGKLHFIRSFDDKQFVYFKDAFQLGSFGSSLEAGFGVFSQLSPKIIFHSDLIYQHKFTNAGFSGTHFSGGLSYHF